MKRHMGKVLGVALALTLAVAPVTGCQAMNKGEKIAVAIKDDRITENEAKLYLYALQYEAETDDADYIAAYYGDVMKFWEDTTYGAATKDTAKEIAIQNLLQTKMLNKYAADHGIQLTDKEKKKVSKVAKAFMKRKDMIRVSGADKDLVEKFVTENAIANKAYLDMIKDVSTKFTKEELRRKRIAGICFTIKEGVELPEEATQESEAAEETTVAETETAAADETAATVEPLSKDKLLKKLNAAVDKAYKAAKKGTSFADIAAKYEKDDYISASELTEYAVSKEDATKVDEETGKKNPYYKFAWSLKTGDLKKKVIEMDEQTTQGYVLKCINDNDKEFKKEAKEQAIADRKAKMFQEKYKEVCDQYLDYHVYDKVWGNVSIKETLVENPNITEAATESAKVETVEETVESASEAVTESEMQE